MMLSTYSEEKLYKSFDYWQVDAEYADPIFKYLVYGFHPGSFFTYVLCNDFVNAIASSHPANTIPALKKLVGWIVNCAPDECWGNVDKVNQWIAMSNQERRTILEKHDLIYTPKEETWAAVKGE